MCSWYPNAFTSFGSVLACNAGIRSPGRLSGMMFTNLVLIAAFLMADLAKAAFRWARGALVIAVESVQVQL